MQQPDADDILRRTLLGVEEELDQIRDTLAQALEDYEHALGVLIDQIPPWAMVDPKAIRGAWRLHTPPLSHTLLGPRAIATLASPIERAVATWFGSSNHPTYARLTHDQAHRDACLKALDELAVTTLAQASSVAKEHVKELREGLGGLGEEIMFELDERREHSRQDLEELIATGDVEQGRAARQELAMLWEQQRERAKGFEQAWAALLGHLNLGEDLTLRGIETLGQMLEQVRSSVSASMFKGPQVHKAPEAEPRLQGPKKVLSTEDALLAFDPYGGQHDPPPIPEESAPRQTGRTKLLAQAKRKQRLDAFFEEPVEENDNLVFEDQSPDPMIDFFEEVADEADSISNSLLFTPEEEPPPAASHSPTRSPYDVFLSEDSSPVPKLPEDSSPSLPAARPLAILPADLFVEEEVFTRDTEPGTDPHKPPTSPVQTPPTPPPDALVPQEVDDASFQTAPMGKWHEDSGPKAHPPAPKPAVSPPERVEPAHTPPPPLKEVASGAPKPAPKEPAVAEMATNGSPRPEDARPEGHRGQVQAQAPRELSQEADSKDPDDRKPSLRTASLSTRREHVVEVGEDVLPLQGSAHRARVGWTPLSGTEIMVGQVLPCLLLFGLIGVSALSDPSAFYYPLRTGSIPHIVSWLLLIWLLLGPWVLRWRVAWRGWRPVLLKRARIQDEVQLLLDVPEAGAMELGPWRLERREVSEVSRARWRSGREEGQGWLLTLVERNGSLWNFSTLEGELERDWSFSSLPMTTPPDDTWQLRAEMFESLERWIEGATHL